MASLRGILRVARRRLLGYLEELLDWVFNRRLVALTLRRDHVLCLGDSHVAVMRHVRVPHVWFRAKPLAGATASGVLNPQSRTSSLERITGYLSRAGTWQQVLLQLGEVDCGFLIWHRARRRNLSIEEQLTYTIESYATFIGRVADMGFARVLVLSVPLPTIGDDPAQWGEIANLRRAVTTSQAERTGLTLRFNAALRSRCEQLDVVFVDVTSGHLDAEAGLIDPAYLRHTHHDHHLADAPYAALISRELRRHWQADEGGR